MNLQQIFYGTFTPPPVVSVRHHSIMKGIQKVDGSKPKPKPVNPRSRTHELVAIMEQHPEGLTMSQLVELTGRSKGALYHAIIHVPGIELVKGSERHPSGGYVEGKWIVK